jgi:hypothetical protein
MTMLLRVVHLGIALPIVAEALLTPRALTSTTGLLSIPPTTVAAIPPSNRRSPRSSSRIRLSVVQKNNNNPLDDAVPDEEEEWSDFVDLGYSAAAAADSEATVNMKNAEPPTAKPSSTSKDGVNRSVVRLSKEDVADENGDDDDSWNAALRRETQRRRRGDEEASGDGTTRTGRSLDYTAVRSRQFTLGKDIILTNYVGDMGFDEVTDWQYYYQDVDEDGRPAAGRPGGAGAVDRKVVQPNPFDSTK